MKYILAGKPQIFGQGVTRTIDKGIEAGEVQFGEWARIIKTSFKINGVYSRSNLLEMTSEPYVTNNDEHESIGTH